MFTLILGSSFQKQHVKTAKLTKEESIVRFPRAPVGPPGSAQLPLNPVQGSMSPIPAPEKAGPPVLAVTGYSVPRHVSSPLGWISWVHLGPDSLLSIHLMVTEMLLAFSGAAQPSWVSWGCSGLWRLWLCSMPACIPLWSIPALAALTLIGNF